MESLFKSVKDFCLTQGLDKTYWVAYSGGLDSHVLLHLLANVRSIHPIQLRSIYINHGLSDHADFWAQHCAQICKTLQIDFHHHAVNAKSSVGESPEEVARDTRYAVFANQLLPGDVLLTAHHQNDQAETILLQMLRGAGPKGLAAMPSIKSFAKGVHGRPLLNFTRDQLQQYAEHYQLHWINDESNTNTSFVRNFIRHEVMPILKKRWPTVSTTLARSAEHCGQAQQLLEQMAECDLRSVAGSCSDTLSVSQLLELNEARQLQALRTWLTQLQFPIPSTVKMRQIQRDMLHAREDKSPHFFWNGMELRRYRDNLYAMQQLGQHDVMQKIDWDLSQPLELPFIGILQIERVVGEGLRQDITHVTVRFRQGGESCRLPNRQQHHELKKLFQEWNIPPWERDRVPLIFVGEKLATVVGFFVSDEFAAKENELGIKIMLQISRQKKIKISI